MSEKQSRNEIKGIDPKSYGSFDKVMDKARRVSRYVLPGVAVALTASCTPEMINALAKTVETPDVSPIRQSILYRQIFLKWTVIILIVLPIFYTTFRIICCIQ